MVTIEKIRDRLVESIKQSGYSQTELAKELHISQSAIAHYMRGDILPSIETLANICLLIDVSPAYILCFHNEN